MAEDTKHIPVSNEIDKINEVESNDHSDEKPLARKKRVVTVPHYLRASTGSCHDACKYGKPHVFVEKPWRAVRRMSAPLPKTEKAVEVQIFVDRKVKKTARVNNLEHTPANKTPATTDTLKKSYLLSKKSPVDDSSKFVKQEVRPLMKSPSPSPKVVKKVVQSPLRLSSPASSKVLKQESASPSKKDDVLKPTLSHPRLRSISAGPLRPTRPAVRPSLSPDVFKGSRGKPAGEAKFSDHPRSSSITVRKVLTPPATTLSVKRSPKLNLKKPVDPPEAMTSFSSSRIKPVKPNNVRKASGIAQSQKSSGKNRVIVKKAELKQPNNEIVEEKPVHIIEIKEDHPPVPPSPISSHFIQSPSPLSPESLNFSSQTNSLSFTSQEAELSVEYTDSDADDSISNYPRNTRNVELDQDPTSLKLKFRKGKVVELKPETNSSRRLRFKQGGQTSDASVDDSGSKRKSYKKRVVDSEKKEANSNQEKVALKHQEMMARDEQVIYNSVIEETASKLVEKRKSKVKALVGAFETVISLQERKPAAARK